MLLLVTAPGATFCEDGLQGAVKERDSLPFERRFFEHLGKEDVLSTNGFDVVCLSHLRWDFVFQRPQHLLSRFSGLHRVFYIEEPVYDSASPWIDISEADQGVKVVRFHLPQGLDDYRPLQERLLAQLFRWYAIEDFILWYYTPMALTFTSHLRPLAVVYDCMDELSAFKGASAALPEYEASLLKKADLVFAGGRSLYEARRQRYPGIHLFPSSVDVHHFAKAREQQPDPPDQAGIPHPRLGFFGVLDERFNSELIEAVALARPDWHIVLLGPVAKIDPETLPRLANIHYLGKKSYGELPAYISDWDVALLPFALNESTRFISPTKVPEYLAAGKRVVSTPIHDVVRSYGDRGLVQIAGDAEEFVQAIGQALAPQDGDWLERVDQVLASMSWERTWQSMYTLIQAALTRPARPQDRLPMVLQP